MKRERGALRIKANTAKQRLGSGFWKSTTHEQVFSIKNSTTREDEEFYERVKGLLVRGVINPLPQIIDRGYLEVISHKEKERYIFELSEKIRGCVKRYHEEVQHSSLIVNS